MKFIRNFLFLLLFITPTINQAMHEGYIDTSMVTPSIESAYVTANNTAKYISSFWSPAQTAESSTPTYTKNNQSELHQNTPQPELNPNDGFDIQMNTPVLDFAGQCIGNCSNYLRKATNNVVNSGIGLAKNAANYVPSPEQISSTASNVANGLGTAAQVVGKGAYIVASDLTRAIGTDLVNATAPIVAPHVVEYINNVSLPEYTSVTPPAQPANSFGPQFTQETQQAFQQINNATINKGVQYGARVTSNELKNVQLRKVNPVVENQNINEIPTIKQEALSSNPLQFNDQTNTEINNLRDTALTTLDAYSPTAGALAKVALNPTLENVTNAATTPGVITTTGATAGAAIGGAIGGAIGYVADAGVQGAKASLEGVQNAANTISNSLTSKPSEMETTKLPNGDDQVTRYAYGQKIQTVIRSQGQGGIVTYKDYDANDKLQKSTTQYPGSKRATIRFYDTNENIEAIKSINADGTSTVTQYSADKVITTNYNAHNQQIGQPITTSATSTSPQKANNSWW